MVPEGERVMTRWIEWLRKLDWMQWLALVALACSYAVIALPFLGVPWKRAADFGTLLLISGAFFLFVTGRRAAAAKSGPSGLSHLGGVAMVMMLLWGQPWWPVPRPQQASDFWFFVWPFIILINATHILSARAPDPDSTARDEEPGLA
jgi:Na+/proline symporter